MGATPAAQICQIWICLTRRDRWTDLQLRIALLCDHFISYPVSRYLSFKATEEIISCANLILRGQTLVSIPGQILSPFLYLWMPNVWQTAIEEGLELDRVGSFVLEG